MGVILLLIGLFLLFVPAVMADRIIHGVVKGRDTMELPKGVVIKYGRRKARVNASGKFMLHVPKDVTALQVMCADFEPQEVRIDAGTTYLEVVLYRKQAGAAAIPKAHNEPGGSLA